MARDDIERLRAGELPRTPSVPVPDAWRPPEPPPPPPPESEPGPAMPWIAAIGASLLALVACVPHLLAPSIAIIVSIVGLPIAWSMRRISTGRRQRLFVTTAIVLGLTIVLALVAPMLWLQLGILQLPAFVVPG